MLKGIIRCVQTHVRHNGSLSAELGYRPQHWTVPSTDRLEDTCEREGVHVGRMCGERGEGRRSDGVRD